MFSAETMEKDIVKNEHIKYFDGLRGYSVVLVMFCHTPYFEYGWIGVPVFFALSGYLITNILINSRTSENYFKAFYSRRILRIFPIYFLCLILIRLFDHYYKSWGIDDLWYYVFYIQNFKLAIDQWQSNFPIFFNHTWSLAVEEQFYLVFPFLVWVMDSKKLKITCICLMFIGLLSRYIIVSELPQNQTIYYVNTICNLDYLGGGALIAIFLNRNEMNGLKVLLKVLTAVCLLLYFVISPLVFHKPLFTLSLTLAESHELNLMFMLPVILSIVLILKTFRNKFLDVVFGNKVFIFLGKISYGLYLYHLPVFYWADHYVHWHNPLVFTGVRFALTILISYISFMVIETPFLNLKRYFNYQANDNPLNKQVS
jgi:peptidoglycan/LPS O-acetylase OafA/YrhL